LRSLSDATRASLAPERGSATFVVRIDGSGAVIDVRLLSADRDRAGWQDACDHARKQLVGVKLAMRGAAGTSLVLGVVSDVQLVSGRSVGEGAPDRPPSNVPPSYEGPGAPFDVTDLAGKVQRVVHSRLIRSDDAR